jgi:hypothetical protein
MQQLQNVNLYAEMELSKYSILQQQMAQKKQSKIASTIEERRASEEQTWYARKRRERTGTSSAKQGANRWTSYSSERPLHVAIFYA